MKMTKMMMLIIMLMMMINNVKCEDFITRWLYRTDGLGKIEIKDKIELILSKTKDNLTYDNAEIYNNPCCMDELKECKTIEYTRYPIEYNKQMCYIMYNICKHNENKDICRLYEGTILLDTLKNPMQLIKDQYINLPYLYGKFDMNITITDAQNGSLGFGLWNTNMETFDATEYIWFMNFNQTQLTELNGFWMMIYKKELTFPKMIKMDEIEYNKSVKYSIEWTKTQIRMYKNDVKLIEENIIMKNNLATHIWIDNVEYGIKYENKKLLFKLNPLETKTTKKLIINSFEYKSL